MTNIPKVIHYVWVGDSPLTPLAQKCLKSWQEHLPDYEFRFWNENNIPMDNEFVKTMYERKRWAFVADYVRFWALQNEGGIYLDTDTEVLKPFDDLLTHSAFFGQTKDGMTAAGVIGAVPSHPVISKILSVYEDYFSVPEERTSPQIVTSVLAENSFPDVSVYDYRYFNPCDDGEKCTSEKLALAYTNNHWAESWVSFAPARKLARRLGIMPLLKKVF